MTSTHWYRRATFLPFAVLLIGTLIGGQLNRVDARGRIADDTTGLGVPGVSVRFGTRAAVTGADGTYELDNLPRGARLDTQHQYYGKHMLPAEQTELRIAPLTVTFEVHDAYSGKGIDTPEARQPDDTQVGKGSASGEMVVGPYPARNAQVLICAKNYQPAHVTATGYQMTVDLTPSQGSECPPLKSPPPTPAPSPSGSPAPSGSGAPTPSPALPPSASP